jgi:hypothetical protein
VISGNPIIGAVQAILMVLILPGLIVAPAFGGNEQAFFLGPAAAVNALIHFGICFLLLRFIRNSKKRTILR